MMLMEKILRYFPLNREVRTRNGKTLGKTIGKYLVIWIAPYIVMSLVSRVPLIGNLLYHLFRVWEYYVLVGIAFGCYQYFSKMDYSNIAYINLADLKRLWSYKQCKIALIIAACIVALIPHGGNAKVQQQKQIEETNSKAIETVSEAEEETAETVVEQEETAVEQEETPAVTQEQKDLYEDVKGYWEGDGIQYSFSRLKDQYYFINSNSSGSKDRVYSSEDFYVAYYKVDSYEKADSEVKAVLSDQDGRIYNLDISTAADGKRVLKIREEGESEWLPLTENTFYSCQELLDAGEYKTVWLQTEWIQSLGTFLQISNVDIGKNDVYCLLDVTEQCEGEELIVDKDDSYYVMGIRDGFLQPLYTEITFMEKERYDVENKILWTFYYGGTAGGSCYRRTVYDEDTDMWTQEEQDEIPETCDKIFFCEIGKDYQEALREEEERLAREEQERADATIEFDESMIITEPIESYVGEYFNKSFSIEINTIDEDMCSIKIVSGIHAVGLGKRATGDGIPDGMAVYSVAGMVMTDNHGNSSNANYAIMLVLKPDGTIFIGNLKELNPSFELPAGTYRRAGDMEEE